MNDKQLSPTSRVKTLSRSREGLEDLFAGIFGNHWNAPFFSDLGWSPAVDLIEHDEELTLRADLPGMNRDDVTISIEEDTLTISGEREMSSDGVDAGGVRRMERSYGRFSRSIRIPRDVDQAEIHAHFARGVLEIKLPRSKEKRSSNVIKIEDGE